ncbi:MAG: hypothetical protein ACTSR6_05775 [Candidatus Heimdallarchaeota archaeon]
MKKKRELFDWLFIILQTLLFMVILIFITALSQDIEVLIEDWFGLPILVIFVISLLGVLIFDDYLRS